MGYLQARWWASYSARTKRRAVCEAAKRNGKEPRSHDCRMNWTASTKVLTEKFSGRARITINKRILESIFSCFADK